MRPEHLHVLALAAVKRGTEGGRTGMMPVWFASITPLTRWLVCTYGERAGRVRSAGRQGPTEMKGASPRSRIRIRHC